MNLITAKFPFGTGEYKRIFKRKDINLKVPIDGKKYVQALHDWLVLGDSRARIVGSNYAHPAIVNKEWGLITRYNNSVYDYVELPEKWQQLIWQMCGWSIDYQLPKGEIINFYTKPTNSGIFANSTPYSQTEYYISIMEKSRAWTDSFAPEVGGRDYVTNRNPNNRPHEFLFRFTTGALLQVEDFGSKWQVKALDVTKDPPPLSEIVKDPSLFYWATEIRPERLPNGTFTVSPFPQAKVPSRYYSLPFVGVAMPLLSLGGSLLINKSACTPVLPGGSSWTPYVP